jgi:hypothetical protein
VALTRCLEPSDGALDVGIRAVLAELGFALDPIDDNLDTDDRLELTAEIRRRRIVHRPRHGAAVLVLLGQPTDIGLDPDRVVMDDETTVQGVP